MTPGLKAWLLTQSGGVGVLRVGWIRPLKSDPDEYETWECTLYREDYEKLPSLWITGEKELGTTRRASLGPPVRNEVHRAHCRPLATLDPEKWLNSCPKPDGFDED